MSKREHFIELAESVTTSSSLREEEIKVESDSDSDVENLMTESGAPATGISMTGTSSIKSIDFDNLKAEDISDESDGDAEEKKEVVVDDGKLKYTWESGVFIALLIAFELFFLVFSYFLLGNAQEEFIEDMEHKNVTNAEGGYLRNDPAFGIYYHVYIEVALMIFLGFGLLMSFLKFFGYFAMGMSFLLACVTVQYALFWVGYAEIIVELIHDHHPEYYVILGLPMMIKSLFAGGVVLISVGVLIGKLSPLQFLIMIAFEIPIYALNVSLVEEILEVSDVGGSMLVHTFGAYFGLMCSWVATRHVIKDPPKKQAANRVSDLFSIAGTITLWIFWPSFNGALEGVYRHRIAVNTYMCLIACCITTFICSRLFRKKFGMEDLQNATLAGGVAIGAASNMEFPVGVPVTVGIAAGLVSSLGYRWVSELLEKLYLHDTCGVNNLHGMPGLLGGIVSIFTSIKMKDELHHHEFQPLVQLAGLAITLTLACAGGLLTGAVIRVLFIFYPPTPHQESYYEDKTYFLVEETSEEELEEEAAAAVQGK